MLTISSEENEQRREIIEQERADMRIYNDDLRLNIDLITKLSDEVITGENADFEGVWGDIDDEFIESLFNHESNCCYDDYYTTEYNNIIECEGVVELSLEKEIQINHNNNPNGILSEGQEVRSSSQLKQTDSHQISNGNKYSMNPRVVLERYSMSCIKPARQTKATDFKTKTVKIRKPLYRCSVCSYKTRKKRKMILHLEDSSHSTVYYKKQAIPNENFFCTRKRKIKTDNIKKSDIRFKLRNKYSNKWFSCSYNDCKFAARRWKLMYNHVKYGHLQWHKFKINHNKHKFKRIPLEVSRNKQLSMKALVILQRLPPHIVSSKIPIPMEKWIPYSNSILLNRNEKRKVKSISMKFPCAFKNCMFLSNNWRTMHLHIKLSHVSKLLNNCNVCSQKGNHNDVLSF